MSVLIFLLQCVENLASTSRWDMVASTNGLLAASRSKITVSAPLV